MGAKWYLTRDGRTNFGPYEDAQLREFAESGRVASTDMVWHEGMPQWVPVNSVPGLVISPPPPAPPPPVSQTSGSHSSAASNKIAAGICGIFLGGLGVHKFILGFTMPGVVLLLVTLLSCGFGAIVTSVIGIVEGVIYLTKSDEEFERLYVIEKKQWF